MDKLRLVLAAALICLALSTTALAAYWIYSITITEVGDYTLSLSSPSEAPRYTNITLTAILKYKGIPAPNKPIIFYIDQGAWNEIGSNMTDSSGTATIQYNVTTLGALSFRAGFLVTP